MSGWSDQDADEESRRREANRLANQARVDQLRLEKQAKREAEQEARAKSSGRTAQAEQARTQVLSLTSSLESLLTSPDAFGLPASALQTALCRAADGLGVSSSAPSPDLAPDALLAHFGCELVPVGLRPNCVAVVSGVRAGKSLIAGAAAFRSACTSDLAGTQPHEVVRVSVLAPTVRLAKKTFRLLTGAIAAHPLLAAIAPPEEWTADTIRLHRPSDDRLVDITVIAADPMGMSLRADWCAGFVFDEVALFGTEASGAAVNAEELLAAASTRLLPGAQGWLISSPYGPDGLLYSVWKEHFGKPSADWLVVHAPTRAMNPAFPADKVARIRRDTPDVAAREYDAQWIDANTAFFVGAQIEAAACPEEKPRRGAGYVAAWDAATRGNAWTLAIARRDGERFVVCAAMQWQGSKIAPLDPETVIAAVARALRDYGITTVHGDQWSADTLRALARKEGVSLVPHMPTPGALLRACRRLATKLGTAQCSLADVPEMITDMKAVRKRALANQVRVDLPVTADGRHCDFVPAVALACDVLFADDDAAVSAETAAGLIGGDEEPSVLVGAMDDGEE